MNFQLPQQDDDFDCYGNSSQDESRGSQGRHFDSSKFSFFFFQSLFCWFAFSLTNLDFCLYSPCLHFDIQVSRFGLLFSVDLMI